MGEDYSIRGRGIKPDPKTTDPPGDAPYVATATLTPVTHGGNPQDRTGSQLITEAQRVNQPC
ncbi:hypothetical protein GNE08_13275 [Trichormus variabilis ARAD]|uniref:Uncharacterized protein n=1 Tax=Trichormus variabilis N2B TaxID=2681315 RepID=A0ABR6S9W3_ANAVA|nr:MULTISPECIES: hypothetical protein [Nostocaceae]MBC1215192.1 hypothetical protein [Trichormus variabilis ARAD]MBC1254105.1 hypothetical protein [Trichormus variabilis V5]MBC1265667.1 hypothetical protein [Trichormus variabilis FSR]MBC1303201.1 hypothetical protein [Trichormus variabilis N2B]MBC1311294.1 hypothetical protein [Trichormus variabilis PNB]